MTFRTHLRRAPVVPAYFVPAYFSLHRVLKFGLESKVAVVPLAVNLYHTGISVIDNVWASYGDHHSMQSALMNGWNNQSSASQNNNFFIVHKLPLSINQCYWTRHPSVFPALPRTLPCVSHPTCNHYLTPNVIYYYLD
jgi:hypothetical protein